MSDIWSVRGVSPALRREIVEAANRAGLTVAEWLDQAVTPSLNGEPANGAGPGTNKNLPPVGDLLQAIDTCLESLEELSDTRFQDS
jgi:hypothetical protein